MLRLADARTHLAMGRFRIHAAHALAMMTRDNDKPNDVSRKACVDLLTVDSTLAPAPKPDPAAAAAALQPPRPSPEAIVRALEKMAEGSELD